MAAYQFLDVERRGAIGIVTLNRPDRLNALNPDFMAELKGLFESLTDFDAPERVIVLRGAGRAFCAGADLNSTAFAEPGPGRAHRQLRMQHLASGVVRAMRACPQPIIALCHGPVCGGGFSIALAADIRLGAPGLKMNAAYLKVGLGGADMGAGYLLTRLVGHSVASSLLLTGDFIEAERAHQVGLLTRLVPQEQLFDEGLAMAERMLEASPLGLRMTKDALNILVDCNSLDAALALEDRQQVILLETEDHRESVRAFMEKRKPEHRNQ